MSKKFLIILIVLLQLPPLTFAVVCIDKYFALNGTADYHYDFTQADGKISNLFPLNRVAEIIEVGQVNAQALLVEPVYFRVKTPVHFANAKLSVKFQPGSARYLEAGAVYDSEARQIALQPLYFRIIEELAASPLWQEIRGAGLRLFQKNNDYGSVQEFLAALPARERCAIYNYEPETEFQIKNYYASRQSKLWPVDLLGGHQLIVYLGKKETLSFEFDFESETSGKIAIFKNNQVLWENDFNGKQTTIEFSAPTAGVYKLSLNIPNDVTVNNIRTTQKLWVFDREVRLAEKEADTALYTRSREVYLQAYNEQGTGKALLNKQELLIAERNKQYHWTNIENQLLNIFLPMSNIKVNSSGPLALSAETYFDPAWRSLKDFTSVEELTDVDYVLVNYDSPRQDGAWYWAEANFDSARIYFDENRRQKFLIAFANDSGNPPYISQLDITFSGAKTWRQRWQTLVADFYGN